jgi:hypothetical protein
MNLKPGASWTSGGGFSAIAVIYSHGTIWPPTDNVLFDSNFFDTGTGTRDTAVYCVYLGNSTTYAPSNIDFVNNVMSARTRTNCDAQFVGWRRHSTNQWSGNRQEDGSLISEPSTTTYAQRSKEEACGLRCSKSLIAAAVDQKLPRIAPAAGNAVARWTPLRTFARLDALLTLQ